MLFRQLCCIDNIYITTVFGSQSYFLEYVVGESKWPYTSQSGVVLDTGLARCLRLLCADCCVNVCESNCGPLLECMRIDTKCFHILDMYLLQIHVKV